MHKSSRALLGATTLLLAAASFAGAQEAPPAGRPPARAEGRPARGGERIGRPMPRMERRSGRMEGRPGRMARPARMARGMAPARSLLAMRDRLALTDDQVRRLESLATTQREALRPNEPAMLRVRADLMEATNKDDIAGARAAMDRMSRLRTDAAIARLEARKAARDVLTPEQREKVGMRDR